MSSTLVKRKRKPLPISAILVIAALVSGMCVIAIPAPHQPPGGFANAAEPSNPGFDPAALPDFREVAHRFSDGIGEVATAVIGGATARR